MFKTKQANIIISLSCKKLGQRQCRSLGEIMRKERVAKATVYMYVVYMTVYNALIMHPEVLWIVYLYSLSN